MTERSTTERAPLQLSITPLGASATQYYPSADGQDRLGSTGLWSHVRAMGWSDEAGTLTLEGSDDRVTWSTIGSALTFTADVINTFDWTALTYRYWRWKFVNGGTAQTLFRLYEDKVPDTSLGSDPQAVTVTGSSTLLAGTGTAPLSGANAAAIAANACNAVVVQNDPDSTVDLMVGNALTVVPLQLLPGQSVTIPVSNTSLVFVRSNHAATNATYNWLAV